VVKQIAFFVEGEEDPRDSRDEMKLRRTFHKVFEELGALADARGIRLQFRLYGTRRKAYEKFRESLEKDGSVDVFQVLLVDSEAPVACNDPLAEPGACWQHLETRSADRWERPEGAGDEQCQLMVQAIEAWLLADPEALRQFYGRQGFRSNALPRRRDVEDIPTSEHLKCLEAATRDTRKGSYHKVKHLSPLLSRLDIKKVRERAPFCNRIFFTLARRIEEF
jgi:hypothetical protein